MFHCKFCSDLTDDLLEQFLLLLYHIENSTTRCLCPTGVNKEDVYVFQASVLATRPNELSLEWILSFSLQFWLNQEYAWVSCQLELSTWSFCYNEFADIVSFSILSFFLKISILEAWHRVTYLPYSINLGKKINVQSHSKVRSPQYEVYKCAWIL